MTFESVFKEAVREYQPKMEELVGARFGEIVVRPLSFERNSVWNNVKTGLKLWPFGGFIYFGKSGNTQENGKGTHVIEYNPVMVLSVLPREIPQFIAAHELGHIGHFCRVENGLYQKISIDWHEAIADYLAATIIGTTNIPIAHQRIEKAKNMVEDTLDRLNLSLDNALPLFGLENTV